MLRMASNPGIRQTEHPKPEPGARGNKTLGAALKIIMSPQREGLTLPEYFQDWAAKYDVPIHPQFHDNQPVGILERFPPEGEKRTTLRLLETEVWWWKNVSMAHPEKIFHHPKIPEWTEILMSQYKDGLEFSAFQYELHARCQTPPAWGFNCPWVWCSREQRQMLGCLWANKTPPALYLPCHKSKPEFVAIGGKFNLKLDNKTLVRQMMDQLNRERGRQGITREMIKQGCRRRNLPWNVIELMDRNYFLNENLNAAQRSQVSKARRGMIKLCDASGVRTQKPEYIHEA
jgi:hypothetical protein